MKRPALLIAAVAIPLTAVAVIPRAPSAPVERMVRAATAWLETLADEQREKAAFAFDSDERKSWHFVPREYPGLSLADMSVAQRRRAHDLLHSALSSRGYLKVTTVMLLEQVLHDIATRQGRRADHRDPERYWFAVFGKPSADAPWGWRVQGHHLSLNFSSVSGELVATTPAFFGANPAEVREGPFAGLRLLGTEEDLARQLLSRLDAAQLERTLISDTAPSDIILGPGREADLLGAPKGLPVAAMTDAQTAVLRQLIFEYAYNMSRDNADACLSRLDKAGFDEIHFAWAGSTEPGKGHYYRIHGPTFVIEYDNTQNDANHVHTVWHDLTDDFGEDQLRRHYRQHEHGKSPRKR